MNSKLPDNFKAYKQYVAQRLDNYPLACHKTQRKLWSRQMRLAVGAGASDATLIKLNPTYKKRELTEQIRWFRRSHHSSSSSSSTAFMAFAKSIGAISYKEWANGS